ncbi:sigma 54 modulation/S30EA ribosomal C-terminal domain-containing protein [Kitasatospora sp. NPDC093806]|uniref:sigma 54 modulation/S30EA ribosomal C-terminal domain-containing protein n=1 Tax=Kitasatospora sp. NPDC093806 TaxID=3155075 RepID=UPI00343352AC
MGELVTVRVCEGISRGFAADARARIAAAVSGADALVESLRVRVGTIGAPGGPVGGAAGGPGPAVAGGVLAQVNAEVDGRRIRVQEAAADLGEALDRLAEGLRSRVAAVNSAWAPRPWPRRLRARGLTMEPAAVGITGAPAVPVLPVLPVLPVRAELPYAAGAQRIVRRKPAHLVWCSPDAAARTMDAMDFDIHLFTDPATETDAVVYRVGPTGYRLARTVAAAPPSRPAVPLTLSPCGAPELTENQAVARLAAAELPYLFFAQPGSGRGRVLYRRFDGALGLIAAAS